jgi:hypothetical protein
MGKSYIKTSPSSFVRGLLDYVIISKVIVRKRRINIQSVEPFTQLAEGVTDAFLLGRDGPRSVDENQGKINVFDFRKGIRLVIDSASVGLVLMRTVPAMRGYTSGI